MDQIVAGIASFFVPWLPTGDARGLDAQAQGMRDFSASLRTQADALTAAVGTASAGNSGPALDAFRSAVAGPAGHAQTLTDAADELERLAAFPQLHADYNRVMWDVVLPVAVVGVLAALVLGGPGPAALRIAGYRVGMGEMRDSFLKRLAEAFGKDEDRAGLKMSINRRGSKDDPRPCLKCGNPSGRCTCPDGRDPRIGRDAPGACPICGRRIIDCAAAPCQEFRD